MKGIQYEDKRMVRFIVKDKVLLGVDRLLNVYSIWLTTQISSTEAESIKILPTHQGICSVCGKEKQVFPLGDFQICQDCLDLAYDILNRNDGLYKCQICGTTFNLFTIYPRTITTLNGEKITGRFCWRVNKMNVFRCASCKRLFLQKERNGIKIRKKYYCKWHYESKYPVKRYSYKPDPVFYRSIKDKSTSADFIGFELEVEFLDENFFNSSREAYESYSIVADKALSTKRKLRQLGLDQFIYLKMDSSIGGFEMVSHPFTYHWFKAHKKRLEKLFKFLLRIGATSFKSGRAGLHFHMNRNTLEENARKRLLFFANNSLEQIRIISQRQGMYDYCEFNKKGLHSCLSNYLLVSYPLSLTYHHDAINCCSIQTIEWRFFRGTLNFKVFEAYVEFIFALKDFVRKYSASYLFYNAWEKFLEYLRINKFNTAVEVFKKMQKRLIGDKYKKV